ncbi:MAG: hypothetical protein ACFFB3_08005, partial [Candidatus Hodarchaeota archaeon]
GIDRYPLMQLGGYIVKIVKVLFPNGTETLSGTVTISWTTYGLNPATLLFELYYSENAGEGWHNIAVDIRVINYNWDTTTVADGSSYLIRVNASDGQTAVGDVSDDVFTIKNQEDGPSILEDNPEIVLFILGAILITVVYILIKQRSSRKRRKEREKRYETTWKPPRKRGP